MPEIKTEAEALDLLTQIADFFYKTCILPDYQQPTSTDTRDEGMGYALSKWTRWTGDRILNVAAHAADDANFHNEAQAIRDMNNALV